MQMIQENSKLYSKTPPNIHEFPQKLLARLGKISTKYSMSIEQLTMPVKYICLRLNTQHHLFNTLTHEVNSMALRPIEWSNLYGVNHCFYLLAAKKYLITENPLFKLGSYYIQSLSSLFTACQLHPKPGEEVLDLTAAPGGKTLILANIMKQEGRLAAVEAQKSRFFKLQHQLKNHQADWVATYWADGRTIGRKCHERFDRILLDAPCSSEARIDKNIPTSWEHWSIKKVKSCARLQFALLKSAFNALKVGGTMVYSTCTLAPEENEMVINRFLHAFPGQILPETINTLTIPNLKTKCGFTMWEEKQLLPGCQQSIRLLPNDYFSNFFICRLKKIG